MGGTFRDGVAAGAVAGLVSGAPSTVWTLLQGGSVLESTAAAGTIVVPEDSPRMSLLAAGAVTHAALSVGWGVVLSVMLPRRPRVVAGAVAGLGIAAVDLGIVGRRLPRIKALPALPQVLDHIAYGAVVAAVLRRRRG